MERCLLSVDWDYFVYTNKNNWGSYLESKRSLLDLWYKRFIQEKAMGRDIRKSFHLSSEMNTFWESIKKHFQFTDEVKVHVSDSHALSYDIAIESDCKTVCLFDSHADLGYGGISSLNFEVNCSNWLGKLLKEGHVKEAVIFYSTHTKEKPEFFKQMNSIFNIKYCNLDDLDKEYKVGAIHICRSGAWTPPWLDMKFARFVEALGIPYEKTDCPERKWDPDNISFADQIKYLMA